MSLNNIPRPMWGGGGGVRQGLSWWLVWLATEAQCTRCCQDQPLRIHEKVPQTFANCRGYPLWAHGRVVRPARRTRPGLSHSGGDTCVRLYCLALHTLTRFASVDACHGDVKHPQAGIWQLAITFMPGILLRSLQHTSNRSEHQACWQKLIARGQSWNVSNAGS